ncbi:hypothetical protein [Lysobacter sp. Root690]|nr:hypothetical protein [Lysobacter sp. Root690]
MPDMLRAAHKIAAAMHEIIRVDDRHKIIELLQDCEDLWISRRFLLCLAA